jgi:type I restriction enzyme, S subunit
MTFRRYSSYKTSGVEWLGEIPRDWDVKRLKQACHVFPSNVDKKSHDGETPVFLCNYTDVYYNDTITSALEFMSASATPEQIAKFTLRAGDTIVTKDSETADDIAIASYVLSDLPGVVCGYHLAMIRPRPPTVGAFVKRLFDSVYVKSRFEVLANGLTRVGLGQYELDNVELPFPSVREQIQIVTFLDRETAKIDKLVAEQRRLIELLEEKRQAVVSHVVTRGLNPNAPMRASGVDWLGDVPAHWEVRRLKYVSPQITVGIVVEPSKYYVDEGISALRSLNIAPGRVTLENLVFISKDANELHAKSKLKAGDLVAVRSGQPGTTAVIPPELDGCNCIDLIIIRKPTNGSEQFLCWYLSSDVAVMHFSMGSGGAIQQHFNVGTAMNLVVPVPPSKEQYAIVDFIKVETNKIDVLSAEAQRTIDLLQERRTSLISAAVTGEIDVRDLVESEAA